MNPAVSVIFFTTLSGAGLGLLAWVGAWLAITPAPSIAAADMDWPAWLGPRLLATLVVGMALLAVGLVSSMFHLGQPQRAWRAFSQWRTSWLSREGVLAVLTFVPASLLLVLAWRAGAQDLALPERAATWLGGVLALLSLLTVACTAMIYASLKPVPAWRHDLVVPAYLAFALLTGLLVFDALFATLDRTASPTGAGVAPHWPTLLFPIGFAAAAAAIKWVYWRDIDRTGLISREAATALEGFGKVSTFERPHTETNYLTREMGFVLARKHSRKLRATALALFAGLPLLMLSIAWAIPAMTTFVLWVAALSALAGAFVERWLFFAEAKHMVTLYY